VGLDEDIQESDLNVYHSNESCTGSISGYVSSHRMYTLTLPASAIFDCLGG